MDEKIAVEFSEQEMEILSSSVSMYLTLANLEVARHKMYKEESMDRLFQKMDGYASAGVLWAKLMKAQGIPQETIAEYLEKVDEK